MNIPLIYADESGISKEIFEVWLQQCLPPVPPNGAAAVMDNVPLLHKSEKIQKAAEAAGRLLNLLPPYSLI